MGFYIEGPAHNKAKFIMDKIPGTQFIHPKQFPSFKDIPEDKVVVCVIDNGAFQAAHVSVDEREFDYVVKNWNSQDLRPRQYLLVDKEAAFKACGYER